MGNVEALENGGDCDCDEDDDVIKEFVALCLRERILCDFDWRESDDSSCRM